MPSIKKKKKSPTCYKELSAIQVKSPLQNEVVIKVLLLENTKFKGFKKND